MDQIIQVYHCMKKRIFVLQKFLKSAERIIFSLVFICFRFTGISYFPSFPSKENVRKQHLSVNAYFWVNMKCSYVIAGRKRWNLLSCYNKKSDFLLVFMSNFCWQYLGEKMKFSVVLQEKQAIGQLFVEDVYIFPIIFFRKCDRRIADLLFFLLYGNEGSFIIINFLKICSQKLGY